MATLRQMVDGVGSLELGLMSEEPTTELKLQDQAIYRRQMDNNKNAEVLVGTILAFGQDGTATFQTRRATGQPHKMQVNVKDLSPVTESFKRSSIQFSPAASFRGRV